MLIGDQVRRVLADLQGIAATRLVGDAQLAEDLGIDSLALTEVLLALEDDLAVSIPDPVQAALRTVDDLIAVVASQVTARVAPADDPGWTGVSCGLASDRLPA